MATLADFVDTSAYVGNPSVYLTMLPDATSIGFKPRHKCGIGWNAYQPADNMMQCVNCGHSNFLWNGPPFPTVRP
jgi:hypothetical protein